MKKVLIITYYWPPSGGPGVQRVLKFAKYLPQFGWQPIILTVKNGEYPAIDESLAEDIPPECKVYKTNSFEPTVLYRKFTGMKPGEKIPVANLSQKNVSWKKKISNWIRLNLFVPDAKIGWIPFAVKEGKKIIAKEQPDIIFSSSPPHTVHLIAKKLAKWSGIKWVADFRDPWTDIYHYDKVKRSKSALKKDLKLEREVIGKADETVVVSKNIGIFLLKQNFPGKSVKIIPNGFDEDDFAGLPTTISSEKFTLTYAGKINNQQNPVNVWKSLYELKSENPEFSEDLNILLMGNITPDVLESISNFNLSANLEYPGYVSHSEMLKQISAANLLLLLIPDTKKNISIVPGKIFEYMATGRRIIGIGPENGDAAEILNETSAGKMFEFDEFIKLKNEISEQYQLWKKGVDQKINNKVIKRYTRKELTKNLADIFNENISS